MWDGKPSFLGKGMTAERGGEKEVGSTGFKKKPREITFIALKRRVGRGNRGGKPTSTGGAGLLGAQTRAERRTDLRNKQRNIMKKEGDRPELRGGKGR